MSYDDYWEEQAEREAEEMKRYSENPMPELENIIKSVQLDKGIIEMAVSKMALQIRNSVLDCIIPDIRKMVKEKVGNMVSDECEVLFAKTFQEVLELQVCIDGEHSWDKKEVSIKHAIKDRLENWIKQYTSESQRKTLIQTMVSQVLSEEMAKKVTAAVEEVKKETIDEIKKDTMKSIVSLTAKALSNDPKLVALMAPSK